MKVSIFRASLSESALFQRYGFSVCTEERRWFFRFLMALPISYKQKSFHLTGFSGGVLLGVESIEVVEIEGVSF